MTLSTPATTVGGAAVTAGGVAAVEVEHVGKVFGSGASAFTALDDVSVTIRGNEFFTLLGPSGCGKTTLLRLVAGFEYPTRGSIRLDGVDLVSQPPYRRPVNTVFQNYALFPHMSVGRNIGFGLEMLGRPRDEIAGRVEEMLALVRMSELRDRATSEISGGQQQRVALARALAPNPRVLLLDEPLSALDFKLRKEMQIELKRMQLETGITFVFVTHDQEEALTMSDRIAVMSEGRLLQVGTPHDIYERPANRFVASFIGETNFLDGRIVSLEAGGTRAVIALAGGATLIAERGEAMPSQGDCTVMIRPEHVELLPADRAESTRPGQLDGRVETVVYSGTDTHYHVRLDREGSSPLLIVRRQNQRVSRTAAESAFGAGDAVIAALPPDAARLLVDPPEGR